MQQLTSPTETQLTVLVFAVQLCLAAVHREVEQGGKLRKPYFELLENFAHRKALRSNFCLVFSVFEVSNRLPATCLADAAYLLMPVLNFWALYPNIFKVLLVDFKELGGWMLGLLERYAELKCKDRLRFKVFEKEVSLLGWTVLKGAY